MMMSPAELANELRRMADLAEAGDSYEGSISYQIPLDFKPGSDDLEVVASYRFGNLEGQRSMRFIQPSPDPVPLLTDHDYHGCQDDDCEVCDE